MNVPTILPLSQGVPPCARRADESGVRSFPARVLFCLLFAGLSGGSTEPAWRRSSINPYCVVAGPRCFIILHTESLAALALVLVGLVTCWAPAGASSRAHQHSLVSAPLSSLFLWSWASPPCSPAPPPMPLTSAGCYLLQGRGPGCALRLKPSPDAHPVAGSCAASALGPSVACTGNLCLSTKTGWFPAPLPECLVLCSCYYSSAMNTLQVSPTS